MKFIKCPYCKEDVTKIWQLFVFPSPIWINRVCRNCKEKIRFNWQFIMFWMGSILFGVVCGNLINKTITIESKLFVFSYMTFFFILPAITGMPLFLKSRNEQEKT